MKKKKSIKRKAPFKLSIAKQPADIQRVLYKMIEHDPDTAMDQLWLYWMAFTSAHIQWGGKKAAKELKAMLSGMEKGILGDGK